MHPVEQITPAPLVKGMFGSEFRSVQHYGMNCGQMNNGRVVHNGGWYNRRGEKLGWGDLNHNNIDVLMSSLPYGELFFVLGERDSFWNFVVETGMFGWTSKVSPTVEAPGIEYVLKRAQCVVGRHILVRVDDFDPASDGHDTKGNRKVVVRQWEDLVKLGAVSADGIFMLTLLAG